MDANVIVAGLASASGPPAGLIDRWQAQAFVLAVSEYILGEVEAAWAKPYWRTRFSCTQAESALVLLRADAEYTEITASVIGVSAHEEDDPVLATAVSANADYLVTGDRELQDLRMYAGIRIISPRDFLALLDEQEDAPDTPTPPTPDT